MNKTYSTPQTVIIAVAASTLLAGSVKGNTVNPSNNANPGKPTLSRHHSVWDDDEESEEDW